MSEMNFGRYAQELEFNGTISDLSDRKSFADDLRTIYDLTVKYDNDYHDYEGAEEEDLFENYSSLTPEVIDDISSGKAVDGDMVLAEIEFMIDVLNAADLDDSFGTEGWRYHLGWN